MSFDKQNFTPRELTLNWKTAFLRGFAMTLPPVAVCSVINLILRGFPDFGHYDFEDYLVFISDSLFTLVIVMPMSVFAAAVVPFIAFWLSCRTKLKSIGRAAESKFQYQLFYCTEIIPVSRYRVITLLPFIFGGVAPFSFALLNGDLILLTGSGFLLLCLSSNAYVFSLLSKFPKGSYIEDSRNLVGGTIYTPNQKGIK
jgi:hypothetical protein